MAGAAEHVFRGFVQSMQGRVTMESMMRLRPWWRKGGWLAALMCLLFASATFAEEPKKEEAPAPAAAEAPAPDPAKTPATLADVNSAKGDLKVMLDTSWTLIAAFLVFFMNLGFAMVESGLCRAKNCTNI